MNDLYAVERVMDIITYMISKSEDSSSLASLDTSNLLAEGYTNSEIAAALSWIIERMASAITNPTKTSSTRILHGMERDALTADAWGMVLTYQHLGFLDAEDVEQILERALVMSADRSVGVGEVKALIAAYVIAQQPLPHSGSRSLLLGSDSVN